MTDRGPRVVRDGAGSRHDGLVPVAADSIAGRARGSLELDRSLRVNSTPVFGLLQLSQTSGQFRRLKSDEKRNEKIEGGTLYSW